MGEDKVRLEHGGASSFSAIYRIVYADVMVAPCVCVYHSVTNNDHKLRCAIVALSHSKSSFYTHIVVTRSKWVETGWDTRTWYVSDGDAATHAIRDKYLVLCRRSVRMLKCLWLRIKSDVWQQVVIFRSSRNMRELNDKRFCYLEKKNRVWRCLTVGFEDGYMPKNVVFRYIYICWFGGVIV